MHARKLQKSEYGQGPDNAREALINAGKTVFAEKGLDGASVRDIAALANVNISLISYHFHGKEGLYRACLETFGNNFQTQILQILKAPTSREDFQTRLRIFIETFILYHLSEHEMSLIIHRDFVNEKQMAREVLEKNFSPVVARFIEFFRSAQKEKILSASIDPEITCSLVIGSAVHLIRSSAMRKRIHGKSYLDKENIDKTIEQIAEHFFHGILER